MSGRKPPRCLPRSPRFGSPFLDGNFWNLPRPRTLLHVTWTENTHAHQSEAVCFDRFGRVADRNVFAERICSDRLQRRRRLLARAGRLRLSAERPSRHSSRRLELERRRAPRLERARGSRLLARWPVAGILNALAAGNLSSRPLLLTAMKRASARQRTARER
jgi:hypothetical protein